MKSSRHNVLLITGVLGAYFITTEPRAAFEHFVLIAKRAVPTTALAHFRQDPRLAQHNIKAGLDAMRPHLAGIEKRFPGTTAEELLELPPLALALQYASGRVPGSKASRQEINARLKKVSRPRAMTLEFLTIAAELNLVPEARVNPIREGSGKFDMAEDCVQIAGLFVEFRESLAHKHPFTDAMLRELEQDGAWLMNALKAPGARAGKKERSPEAIERDQLARLLEERHDKLRIAAAVVFGLRKIDENVPALYSGTRVTTAEVDDTDDDSNGPNDAPA